MNLQEKTVLITGGSRGIGAAAAKLFGTAGAKVAINYHSSPEEARAVADEINQNGQAAIFKADVADPQAVKAMIGAVITQFGSLDVVVNNAGILSMKPIEEEEIQLLNKMVAVNLAGPVNVLHYALPQMEQQGGGVVVNISSQAAKVNFAQYTLATYSATKAGVIRLTEVLADETEAANIRHYAVLPGGTATDMTNQQGMPPEKVGQRIIETAQESLGLKSGEHSEIYQ